MKKKLLFTALSVILSCSFTACGSVQENDTATSSDTVISTTEEVNTSETAQENNPYDVIDNFIANYNSVSDLQISNLTPLDISGADYRTEYRLRAFENAVGEKGTIGNNSIQIVNYGVYKNDSLRFYLTADSSETAVNICYGILSSLNSSVTYEEISNTIMSFNPPGSSSEYFDSNYTCVAIKSDEIMIDFTNMDLRKHLK